MKTKQIKKWIKNIVNAILWVHIYMYIYMKGSETSWNESPYSTSRKFRYSRSRLRTRSQFRVLAPRIWFQCGSVTCFKSKTRTLFQHVDLTFLSFVFRRSLPLLSSYHVTPLTPFPIGGCIFLLHHNGRLISLFNNLVSFFSSTPVTLHSLTQMPPYKLLFSRTVSAKRRNVSREGAYVLSSCRWKGACLPTYGTRTMPARNIATISSLPFYLPTLIPNSLLCLLLFCTSLWPPWANLSLYHFYFWCATFCRDYFLGYWNCIRQKRHERGSIGWDSL